MTGQNISLSLHLRLCLYLFIHNFPIQNLFGFDHFSCVFLCIWQSNRFLISTFKSPVLPLFKLTIQFTLTKLLNLEELMIFMYISQLVRFKVKRISRSKNTPENEMDVHRNAHKVISENMGILNFARLIICVWKMEFQKQTEQLQKAN